MSDTNYIGNVSTIIKYISMIIAGLFISFITSHGLNLNVDESIISDVVFAIIMFGLAHIDAKNPNDIFDEKTMLASGEITEDQAKQILSILNIDTDEHMDSDEDAA